MKFLLIKLFILLQVSIQNYCKTLMEPMTTLQFKLALMYGNVNPMANRPLAKYFIYFARHFNIFI